MACLICGWRLGHYPIAVWLRDDNPWPVTMAVTFALGFPLAIASYHLVESPMHRFRKRRLEPVAVSTQPG